MNEDHRLGIGGNHPPAYDPAELAQAEKLTNDALAAAKHQFDLGPIMDAVRAGEITDVVAMVGASFKSVEAMRVKAKKPHDDAAAEVQKVFMPMTTAMKTDGNRLKDMAADWLSRENARMQREQREREAAARKAQEEAWAQQQMAESKGDTLAAAGAADAAAEAEKAVAATSKPVSAKMESASGAGRTIATRTVVSADITNLRAVFMHFEKHPDVLDVLQRLSNAAIRAGEDVPGANRAERLIAA